MQQYIGGPTIQHAICNNWNDMSTAASLMRRWIHCHDDFGQLHKMCVKFLDSFPNRRLPTSGKCAKNAFFTIYAVLYRLL